MTIPYFGPSAIGGLLRHAKQAAGIPDELPAPTPWNPNASPVQAGMQGLLAQNLGANPVQGEGPGLPAEPVHEHRKGLRGLLSHVAGSDRVSPELAGLLTPDQQKQVRGSAFGNILRSIVDGESPQTQQEKRAARVLGLVDAKKGRDLAAKQQADWAGLQAKYGQQPSDPAAAQRWMTAMARDAQALGLPQAKELVEAADKLGYDAKVLGPGSKLVGPSGDVLAEGNPIERNPIMGSPEWREAVKYQSSLIGQNDRTLVAVDDGQGNPVYIPRSEAAGRKPWYQPGAGARGSAAMRKAVAANQTSMQEIQDLVATLSQPGDAKANAVGWKAYIPDAVLNRLFPEGVTTRSGVQNVGSLLLHDRFGAALTKTELSRAGFIPFDTDDSRTAIDKLNRLLTYLGQENGFLEDQVSQMGTPAPASSPPPKGKSITVNGKTFIIPEGAP